jgi:hypothetical protein
LKARGIDPGSPGLEERILMLDAAETLDRLCTDGRPDPALFREVIETAVDRMLTTTKAPRIRAYGEMVDLLWGRGEVEATGRLETYWNRLLHSRPVTLLCGYRMNLLHADQGIVAIEEICNTHSEAHLGTERKRLDQAVAQAFEASLGPFLAHRFRPLIDALVLPTQCFGQAERTLFWLQRNLPDHVDPVLSQARHHYEERITTRGT